MIRCSLAPGVDDRDDYYAGASRCFPPPKRRQVWLPQQETRVLGSFPSGANLILGHLRLVLVRACTFDQRMSMYRVIWTE